MPHTPNAIPPSLQVRLLAHSIPSSRMIFCLHRVFPGVLFAEAFRLWNSVSGSGSLEWKKRERSLRDWELELNHGVKRMAQFDVPEVCRVYVMPWGRGGVVLASEGGYEGANEGV
nr:uncharacterized protein LOC112279502 isoform X2 [Physcomitrium patens]|eukprot:XP_024369782.1 uncharacterized protein LOC112279502 isoform X2 [Physcomitrella patens]